MSNLSLLWMWPRDYSVTLTHLTIDNSRLAFSRFDVQILSIARQDLHAPTLELLRINKHTPTIIIALERLRHTLINTLKRLLLNLDLSSPRPSLTRILEPLKSQSPTHTREERQLPLPLNSHLRIIKLKLTSRTSVIPTRAES